MRESESNMSNVYLHLDMNNFYASVECAERPELRNVPVAVAGDPQKRHGVVLAKNQIAKAYGVKTGDTVSEAKAKAPEIVFVSPQFDKYDRVSKKMFGLCNQYTCYVEPFGPDECWMDCTQTVRLFGSGKEIADTLRERIRRELGLTASVGVSFTKLFAKLGSDMKKPDATTVISEENFREVVWPLSADEICGVGRQSFEKLKKMNIRTIGDLANTEERVLRKILGKPGADLRKAARGEDTDGVREAVVSRDAKSIGHGLTTLRDLKTEDDIATLVYYLSELIAVRMKKGGVKARGVAVNLRSFCLSRQGRQTTLPCPICSSSEIAEAALALVRELWDGTPLRSLDVSVFMLSDTAAPQQLSFFDDSLKSVRCEQLDRAVADIRRKYGKQAVLRACHAEQDLFRDKNVGDFLPFKR